jgi:hypothetical protein
MPQTLMAGHPAKTRDAGQRPTPHQATRRVPGRTNRARDRPGDAGRGRQPEPPRAERCTIGGLARRHHQCRPQAMAARPELAGQPRAAPVA